MEKLPRTKINAIRRCFLKGKFSGRKLAAVLLVGRSTVDKYISEFKEIRRLYPQKLNDFNFLLPRNKQIWHKSPKFDELIKALPGLVENSTAYALDSVNLWQDYKKIYPHGYCQETFYDHFKLWKKQNNICP